MEKITIKIILFILFIILYSTSACFASERVTLDSFMYGMYCKYYKDHNLSEKAMDITFSDKPQVKKEGSYWKLDWYGIDVLIPKISYESIYVREEKNGKYGFIIIGENETVLSLSVYDNYVFDDIFAVSNFDKKEVITTQEGISSTKAMAGRPIKQSDLMLFAYETSPNQITCRRENYVEEIGKIVALILKSTAEPDLVEVYRGVGKNDGWITKSQIDNDTEYTLNVLKENDPKNIYYITYKFHEDISFHSIPFLIATEKNDNMNEPLPDWVIALNSALKNDTNDSWQQYFIKAEEQGIITSKNLSEIVKRRKLRNNPNKSLN